MSGTKIEYMNVGAKKGETWSPWIGCTRISPGCDHCWAGREEDGRFRRLGRCYDPAFDGPPGLNNPPKGEPYFMRGPVYQEWDALMKPMHWKKPRHVFVGSRCDIFHDDIGSIEIDQIFAVMGLCPQHTFQVLTKRPERMRAYLKVSGADGGRCSAARAAAEASDILIELGHRAEPGEVIFSDWPLRNVLLGVTVEDQQRADERIPLLLQCPAAVRYVSYEPALGAVDWARWLPGHAEPDEPDEPTCSRCGEWWDQEAELPHECPLGFGPTINWVICGGESGKGARPMHPDIPRQARDQCAEAGVPYFFKQWGEWIYADQTGTSDEMFEAMSRLSTGKWARVWDPERVQEVPPTERSPAMVRWRVGKKAAGRLLDGKLHDAMPEVPQ